MSADRSVSLHVSRRALWAIGVLLLTPWLLLGAWAIYGKARPSDPVRAVESSPSASPANAPAIATSAKAALPEATNAKPGPWGELVSTRILLEPPEEFVLTIHTTPTIDPWVFKGFTEDALDELWTAAGLNEAQRRQVNDGGHHTVRRDAIVIQPTRELIESLSPHARAKIYAALAPFPDNPRQFGPYRLRSSVAEGWFDQADLPADAVALTKKLLYARGVSTCFADDAVVLGTIPDPEDRARFIKVLSRKSGLMVSLKVNPGQNVDRLVSYWARGGRMKDLRPLLQSLARRPSGGSIDIVHLLPHFVRQHIYTYPLPSDKPTDAAHDCHWTSFNFFNDLPDERFASVDYVKQVLQERYYPVPGDSMLGDIVMFVRGDGTVVHSCVYIADDIVFTKNGLAFSVPWLLTSFEDVQAFYASDGDIHIRRFRPKHL